MLARILGGGRLRRRGPCHAHVQQRGGDRRSAIRELRLVDNGNIANVDVCGAPVGAERVAALGNRDGPEQPGCQDVGMKIAHARSSARIGRDRRSLAERQSEVEIFGAHPAEPSVHATRVQPARKATDAPLFSREQLAKEHGPRGVPPPKSASRDERLNATPRSPSRRRTASPSRTRYRP